MLRRTWHLLPVFFFCVLLKVEALQNAPSGQVVDLEDSTFDQLTKDGVWLIDVYAPWCSHCRQLEPIWHSVAKEGVAFDIYVGKIDGTAEKVLLQRFGVAAFPSIFLLRDGRTWQYSGARSLKAILEFANHGYKSSTPEPFFKAPNGIYGRLRGAVFSLPGYAKKAYQFLRDKRGYSDLFIVGMILGIPVFIGALLICVVDAIYTRRSIEHAHYE